MIRGYDDFNCIQIKHELNIIILLLIKVVKDYIVNYNCCTCIRVNNISFILGKGRFNSSLEESFRAKIFERSKVPSWLRNHSNDVKRIRFHFLITFATVGNGKEKDTLVILL